MPAEPVAAAPEAKDLEGRAARCATPWRRTTAVGSRVGSRPRAGRPRGATPRRRRLDACGSGESSRCTPPGSGPHRIVPTTSRPGPRNTKSRGAAAPSGLPRGRRRTRRRDPRPCWRVGCTRPAARSARGPRRPASSAVGCVRGIGSARTRRGAGRAGIFDRHDTCCSHGGDARRPRSIADEPNFCSRRAQRPSRWGATTPDDTNASVVRQPDRAPRPFALSPAPRSSRRS